MRGGHHEVARAYVLYRERRAQERARQATPAPAGAAELHVVDGGRRVPLDMNALRALVESCLLYTSPSPRDRTRSRMPSSA